MAFEIAKVSASPHALRYAVSGDINEVGSRTPAQLVADCAAGPLKAAPIQTNASGDVAWRALGESNNNVSIVVGGYKSQGLSPSTAVASFYGTSGARRLDFLITRSAAGGGTHFNAGAIVEIRFRHSIER
jgi:hypothetical protein